MSHSYVIIKTFEGLYFPLKKLIVSQNFKLVTCSASKINVVSRVMVTLVNC